MLAEGIS